MDIRLIVQPLAAVVRIGDAQRRIWYITLLSRHDQTVPFSESSFDLRDLRVYFDRKHSMCGQDRLKANRSSLSVEMINIDLARVNGDRNRRLKAYSLAVSASDSCLNLPVWSEGVPQTSA